MTQYGVSVPVHFPRIDLVIELIFCTSLEPFLSFRDILPSTNQR